MSVLIAAVRITGWIVTPSVVKFYVRHRERKFAEYYNNINNFISLNCNQHFRNFKPQQFPSAV